MDAFAFSVGFSGQGRILKFGIARLNSSEPFQTAIKRRRLQWSHNNIVQLAIRWAHQGKRMQVRS